MDNSRGLAQRPGCKDGLICPRPCRANPAAGSRTDTLSPRQTEVDLCCPGEEMTGVSVANGLKCGAVTVRLRTGLLTSQSLELRS